MTNEERLVDIARRLRAFADECFDRKDCKVGSLAFTFARRIECALDENGEESVESVSLTMSGMVDAVKSGTGTEIARNGFVGFANELADAVRR